MSGVPGSAPNLLLKLLTKFAMVFLLLKKGTDMLTRELEVLLGSKDLIDGIDYIYVECSFVELYKKQVLVNEVISFLNKHSFKFEGIYNMFYDKYGVAIRGDLLFRMRKDNEG